MAEHVTKQFLWTLQISNGEGDHARHSVTLSGLSYVHVDGTAPVQIALGSFSAGMRIGLLEDICEAFGFLAIHLEEISDPTAQRDMFIDDDNPPLSKQDIETMMLRTRQRIKKLQDEN